MVDPKTQSEEDFTSFRFMLTEETREKSLLRRNRSSTDAEEQILQFLNARRPSQAEDTDDNSNKTGLAKIVEEEEPKKVKEIKERQSPEEPTNKKNDGGKLTSQLPDQENPEEDDEDLPKVCCDWERVPEKDDDSSSDSVVLKSFFIENRAKEVDSTKKPPIYRNINVVYKYVSRLKNGIYITVNRYYSRIRKMDVAIKIIPKIGMPDRRFYKFVPRELDLAEDKKFGHPNIIKYLETYEIGLRVYIMMEYAENGNLSEFITAKRRLDPVTYRNFFSDLVNGVNYCLDYGIAHRKLSTDNCLITKDYVLKICDFSYCRPIKQKSELLDTFCGVLGFTAPEILMCREYHPAKTEAWSCGVILFTMVYGAMPFDSSIYARLLKQVLKPIKYHWFCDTPIDAIIIMYQSISPISRRWSIKKLLGHGWVTPPSTKGYQNYMKWYKKRTRGPCVPVVRKKFRELMELIQRDYVKPLNEKQEQMYQAMEEEEEASEEESPVEQSVKELIKLCEWEK